MFYQLLIGVFCVYVIWKMRFDKKNTNQPPVMSRKLPLIGHNHLFLCNSITMYQRILEISEECRARGGVLTASLGFRKVYLISDPEDCLTISNACLNKDEYYKLGKPLLGNGLVVSDAPTWKKHRKLLNPAFSQVVLNSFMGIFNSQARLLVQMFAGEIGEPFDHEKLLRINNLETICLTATGIGGEEYSNLQNQYLGKFSIALNLMLVRFQRFWLHKNIMFNMSKLKQEQDKVLKSLLELSNKITQMKKNELKEYKNCAKEIKKPGKLKPFMELILDLANETGCFTDEEIREETDNIIAAGHDTSASILTYFFTILGTYPDIQCKVYDEIIEVSGRIETDLDKDNLSKLVYTEAVLKETMRLYPIAPAIGRYADKAVNLKNCTVEANTGCVLLICGMNRHPMWGPDAERFRPERWLDIATLPDPNYFGAFGLGRRSCIGKVYAMMSMKTVIVHVMRRYRISADVTKMVLKWEVMTRPVSGHEITLELRNACE